MLTGWHVDKVGAVPSVPIRAAVVMCTNRVQHFHNDDDELMLNVLRCHETY